MSRRYRGPNRPPDKIWGDGPIRMICYAEGHVMCSRPRAAPFVMSYAEWAALPEATPTESDPVATGDADA